MRPRHLALVGEGKQLQTTKCAPSYRTLEGLIHLPYAQIGLASVTYPNAKPFLC